MLGPSLSQDHDRGGEGPGSAIRPRTSSDEAVAGSTKKMRNGKNRERWSEVVRLKSPFASKAL